MPNGNLWWMKHTSTWLWQAYRIIVQHKCYWWNQLLLVEWSAYHDTFFDIKWLLFSPQVSDHTLPLGMRLIVSSNCNRMMYICLPDRAIIRTANIFFFFSFNFQSGRGRGMQWSSIIAMILWNGQILVNGEIPMIFIQSIIYWVISYSRPHFIWATAEASSSAGFLPALSPLGYYENHK